MVEEFDAGRILRQEPVKLAPDAWLALQKEAAIKPRLPSTHYPRLAPHPHERYPVGIEYCEVCRGKSQVWSNPVSHVRGVAVLDVARRKGSALAIQTRNHFPVFAKV